jgi:hypothetical protein
MAYQGAAAPVRDPLVELRGQEAGKVTGIAWLTWLRQLRADIDAAPASFTPVQEEGQNASIGTTAMPSDGDLSEGLYRVTVYQRITTVASVNSSLATTISWTDGGVSCTFTGTALTGNTTDTVGSFTFMLRSDAASPISYSTTYASNAAGEMRYSLFIVLERLAAL